jgi:hypothetical protein
MVALEAIAERRRSKGTPMSRNLILATGVLLWALTAADAVAHIVVGDWIVPASMAIVAVAWLTVRRTRRSETVTASQGVAA